MSTYSDASLIFYPSGYEAGILECLKPTDGTGNLTFTRASTATRVNESGLIESVATGVPRIDFTGGGCGKLLLEPQRANGIRNSTIVGAVAGSPGTLPTNWAISGTAGLTQTIVAIGTENGLNYIDFRLNGTTTSTTIQLRQELSNIISAATGQTWSQSAYFKLVAGTLPLTTRFLVTERNIANGFVTESVSPTFTISSSLIRYQYQQLLNGGATTAFVQPTLQFTFANATAYDFTIRIAAPQMELGNYATSFIPTTTTAVTRVQETAGKTGISALIGQTEGTLYFEGRTSAISSELCNINQSAINAIWFTTNSAGNIQCIIISDSVTFSISSTVSGISNNAKMAVRYKSNNFAFYVNGVLIGTNTTATWTPNTQFNKFQIAAGGWVGTFNQTLCQAAIIFPTAKSNAELATLTTL